MDLTTKIRRELVSHVTPVLPRSVRVKVVPKEYAWGWRDLRPHAKAGKRGADVRLLIAPANYASQGLYWARAASTLPGVSAQNLAFGYSPSTIVAKPDNSVHGNVGRHSHVWARRQRRAILRDFTHVLYEAERPILGGMYGGDVQAEISDLQSRGIKVAMVSHGSDVRTPSRHVRIEPFSPFRDPLDGLTDALEIKAARNHKTLDAFDVPKFVSTPDLIQYVPNATWLPTLTDGSLWANLTPVVLGERKPVVLHVPSRSALKGTQAIGEAMRALAEEGLIDYVEAERVPYSQMPSLVERADIVVDQVSMGLYGVASVETMLAGRIAVAQAGDYIRGSIREQTGYDLPIVEANPSSIGQVVKDIAINPDRYRHLQEEGRQFALSVHSMERAAATLRPFLLS